MRRQRRARYKRPLARRQERAKHPQVLVYSCVWICTKCLSASQTVFRVLPLTVLATS